MQMLKNYHDLHLEIRGHTALITLSNPPANTWNHENLTALAELISNLGENRDIYALVLTGQGEKFFSAGADLKLFAGGDTPDARELVRLFGVAFAALSHFRGVSIAALNGYAMGGGLEAALSCDLRIAESQVQMALPEASVGLLPGASGTQLLPRLVGEGWAKRMILCGEKIDAVTAERIGLIEQIVPRGQVVEAALALAEKVARQSPVSVAACKKLIQVARNKPIQQGLQEEREAFFELFKGEDLREGVNAFLEKRSPCWKNR